MATLLFPVVSHLALIQQSILVLAMKVIKHFMNY